jgi:ADP-L-glycero-D-manno-heptose 6-epimerase
MIPDVTRYDWVIHLGAISDTTEKDVDKVWAQNFEFTSRLIQVCDQYGVNLQYASTSAVYGPGYDGFKEDSKCLPQTPYAWSKYLIDKSVKDIGTENFQNIIQGFRYFNVYGPGEGHKKDQMSMVSKWREQAARNGSIVVFNDSDAFHRDLICVYDVCKIHEKMMATDVSGIFNCGTGIANNLQETAEIIAKKTGANIIHKPMPIHLQNQYQVHTQADMTKIKQHIELPKFWSVEEFLNDTSV